MRPETLIRQFSTIMVMQQLSEDAFLLGYLHSQIICFFSPCEPTGIYVKTPKKELPATLYCCKSFRQEEGDLCHEVLKMYALIYEATEI